MIKDRLKHIVETALDMAIKDGKMGSLTERTLPVAIERTRLPEHGDLCCGIALKLKAANLPPLKIAETIASYFNQIPEAAAENIARFYVAPPGFINFHLGTGWLKEELLEINKQGAKFGQSNFGKKQKVLVEYVSANPTGNLHIGHGRNAVFGSCLANLLLFAGFEVEQEFYLNDTGEQIFQLGQCAWAIYQRKLGREIPYPEDGYPESSLVQFILPIIERYQDQFLKLSAEEGMKKLGDLVMEAVKANQEKLLGRMGIRFDRWFSERDLHRQGKVDDVLQQFKDNGWSFEAEGALWLKAKELGDERDRVLRKSAGSTTYLAADAAYHKNKYARGYDRFITIWGADHHGQVPGLRAAVKALGEDPERLEIILTQFVNLFRDGQMVRMSKREGTVVTLEELVEEVGVDATRYYLGESNPQNPINFDLELAKQTSKENPAFYIQYAHARCCSILRRALEPVANTESQKIEPPVVSKQLWEQYIEEYKSNPEVYQPVFDQDPALFATQKALIMRLESLPEEVCEAAQARQPGRLARYAYDVANLLQKFYEVPTNRVITDDPQVTKARLGLILATRQVVANVLGIIGVAAPERM